MDARGTYTKILCGPKGFACSCCFVGPKSYAKTTNARAKRRASRVKVGIALRKGLDLETL